MVILKNKAEIEKMRVAGHALADITKDVSSLISPGVTTSKIDRFIEDSMKSADLVPICKGYCGYKHASCISLNDTVIHGIPSDEIILKSGDFVKIDVVGSYKGYCADLTRYFFVGEPRENALKLAAVAQRALDVAIDSIKPGMHLSDISSIIQKEVESAGFGVVRNFAGHGIGKSLHEDPEIPNYGEPGCGPILKKGMTLAIEPMITEHDYSVKVMNDGWTIKTVDGGLAAHVEDTIVILEDGVEILTRL